MVVFLFIKLNDKNSSSNDIVAMGPQLGGNKTVVVGPKEKSWDKNRVGNKKR